MQKIGSKRETTHTVISDIQELTSSSRNNEFTHFVFRGQADESYLLVPSLARKRTYLDNESNIISMATYRKPEVFTPNTAPIELLAKLQHYGIPTRLLDVTRNALVALYFACCDKSKQKQNGVIYIFKYDIRTTYNIQKLELAHKANQWCEGKVSKELQNLRKPIIIEAPADLLRQNVQQGMYMFFLNDYSADEAIPEFAKGISPMQDNDPSIVGKIIISSRGKDSIITQLESLGISESTLFPENIDLFSREMMSYFDI